MKYIRIILVLIVISSLFGCATNNQATTERASVAANWTQGNDESWLPSISADGRYVAFSSLASNLVPGDTNGLRDVFVHDRDK
jgi:Tol biopolymer transport system component